MYFFDDTTFSVFEGAPTAKMIGAILIKNPDQFQQDEKVIKRELGIASEFELKWNLNPDLRKRIGDQPYNDYKHRFMGLIIQSCTGYIGVSQSSKNEALELLLQGCPKLSRGQLRFDEDLVEDITQVKCVPATASFAASSSDIGIQAADYFTGANKLLLQQRSGIHGRSILVETPGYGPGRVPAEFILRMETRWMLEGPTQEDEYGLPWINSIGYSVFLSPQLSEEVRELFESHFGNCYMGCIH